MKYSKLIENIRQLARYSDTDEELTLLENLAGDMEDQILDIRKNSGNYNYDKISEYVGYIPRNLQVYDWIKSYTKLTLRFNISDDLISDDFSSNLITLINELFEYHNFEYLNLDCVCHIYYDLELTVKVKLNGSRCNNDPELVAGEFDTLLRLIDNIDLEICQVPGLTFNTLYEYIKTKGEL